MVLKDLSFSISIAFISWIVGMLINAFIKKTDFYNKHLNHLNFIKSKKANKIIGMPFFKWMVRNTFFRFFNQKLKLKSKIEKADLIKLRAEMTTSEIDHLIAFIFVTCFAIVAVYHLKFKSAGIMVIVNILMNLYPSLLQQENKRRIDHFIHKF